MIGNFFYVTSLVSALKGQTQHSYVFKTQLIVILIIRIFFINSVRAKSI